MSEDSNNDARAVADVLVAPVNSSQNSCGGYLRQKWLSMFWPNTPDKEWYYGGCPRWRLRGNHCFHFIVGLFYFSTCIWPLWHYFNSPKPSAKETAIWLFSPSWHGITWALITTVGLPLFVWWENLGFNDWINSSNLHKNRKKKLKDRFDLNSKSMEATWKSIAGLYLVGGLLSFSGLGNPEEKNETTALAKAIDALQSVVNNAGEQPLRPEIREAISALAYATKAMSFKVGKTESPPPGLKIQKDQVDGASAPQVTQPSKASDTGASQSEAAATPVSAPSKP